VAVLPFTASGPDADEYIAQGLADEVRNALFALPNVRVIGAASSRETMRRTQDVTRTGKLLGVQWVLRGNVQRTAGGLALTVELFDTTDGACRWSKQHESDSGDAMSLQREATASVVSHFSEGPLPAATTGDLPNAMAYDAYLKARYHTGRSGMQVRSFLGDAIALDPDFALPHAHLATYFFTLVVIGLMAPDQGLSAARASARRALDLDSSLAEAEAVLATIAGIQDFEWGEAEKRFQAPLEREPVAPAARLYYANWLLSPLGRRTEALKQLRLALRDDPLSLIGRLHVAMELHSLGQVAEATSELERLLEIDPQFGPAIGFLGHEYVRQGRLEDALMCAERSLAVLPSHPNAVGFLAGVHRRMGDHARSELVLETAAADRPFGRARARAECHLVCGEVGAAARWLETAIENRDPGIWLVLAGDAGNLIRTSRHWKGLAARMNIS
jgi:TolB-like protein/Tfp pilus assembly protein PilF